MPRAAAPSGHLHVKPRHAARQTGRAPARPAAARVPPRGTNGHKAAEKSSRQTDQWHHAGASQIISPPRTEARQALPRRGRRPSACRAPPAYFLQTRQRPIRKKRCRQFCGEIHGALEGQSMRKYEQYPMRHRPTHTLSPPPLPTADPFSYKPNTGHGLYESSRQADRRNAGRRHYARTAVPGHPL